MPNALINFEKYVKENNIDIANMKQKSNLQLVANTGTTEFFYKDVQELHNRLSNSK